MKSDKFGLETDGGHLSLQFRGVELEEASPHNLISGDALGSHGVAQGSSGNHWQEEEGQEEDPAPLTKMAPAPSLPLRSVTSGGFPSEGGEPGMAPVNRRTLEWLYALILLATVLLSWGYVIYATRIAAKWQLKENYPTQAQNL